MGKDKKSLNPADAFRREQKKIDAKKNKFAKQKVQEVRDLLNHPSKLDEKIKSLQKESDENKLDKSLKDQIKHFKDMYDIAIKKQKMSGGVESNGTETTLNISSTSNQSTGPVSSSTSSSLSHIPLQAPVHISRRPDESIYYHPVYNPSGQPPLGQAQVYKPLQPPKITSSGPHPLSYQSIPMGGRNGIPPPPPRGIGAPMSIPMGGMNGIPPPPPPIGSISMPMNMMMPLPPPYGSPAANHTVAPTSSILDINHQTSINKQSYGSRVSSSMQVVDPLDPNARGFTHRFNTDISSSKHHPSSSSLPSSSLPSSSAIIHQPPPPPDDSMISGLPIYTYNIDEPVELNIEEIMKRRYDLSSSSSSSSKHDAHDDADDEMQYDVAGPMMCQDYDISTALPSAEELLQQQHLYDDHHIDDDIIPSLSSSEVKPLSLAVLGDYGDSDDDDDDEVVKDVHVHVPSYHAPDPNHTFIQPSSSSYPTSSSSMISSYPTSSSSMTSSSMTSSSMASSSSMTSSSSSSSSMTSSSQPKIIKADANLVKFVPSSIRVKRPLPSSSSSSNKTIKIDNQDHHHHVSPSSSSYPSSSPYHHMPSSSSSSSSSSVPISSVDDAYKQFLDEIGALGGLE